MRKTDWDRYYNGSFFLSKYTRKITGKWLVEQFALQDHGNDLKIAEFGGANSCFFKLISDALPLEEFTIYDNNKFGSKKFIDKYKFNPAANSIVCDLTDSTHIIKEHYDIVFSVGLVEHFDKVTTELLIKNHFLAAKPGSIVVIVAPTPSFLYHFIRRLAELFNVWSFPDERPIPKFEMHQNILRYGEILQTRFIWEIGLTQYGVVARKTADT